MDLTGHKTIFQIFLKTLKNDLVVYCIYMNEIFSVLTIMCSLFGLGVLGALVDYLINGKGL